MLKIDNVKKISTNIDLDKLNMEKFKSPTNIKINFNRKFINLKNSIE